MRATGRVMGHEVGEGVEEAGVGADGRRPHERHTQLVCRPAGLGVQVPADLDMVGEEAERDDEHAVRGRGVCGGAGGGHVAEGVDDVRLQPGDARRSAARLVDQPPVEGTCGVVTAADATDDFGGDEAVGGAVTVLAIRPPIRLVIRP